MSSQNTDLQPYAELTARREALQMAIADVASRLLLSAAQVRALETGDASAFYNAAFHARALQRYRTLLGLPEPQPSGDAVARDDVARPGSNNTVDGTTRTDAGSARAEAASDLLRQDTTKVDHSSTGPVTLPTTLVLLALVAAIVGLTQSESLQQGLQNWASVVTSSNQGANITDPLATASEASPEPLDSATEGPAEGDTSNRDQPLPSGPGATSAATATTATIATAADRDATTVSGPYEIEARGLCWVFARDAGGKETETVLRDAQRLSLPDTLVYLALGDLTAVTVSVGGNPLNVAQFSRDGHVVRLRQAELSGLRTRATGGSAPPR